MNPFLTRMMFRLSLSGWRKYTKSVIKKHEWKKEVENQRKLYQTLGKEFKEPEYQEDSAPREACEIEKEVLIEMSCSSDDEEENVQRPRTNQSQKRQVVHKRNSLRSNSIQQFRFLANMTMRYKNVRHMNLHQLSQLKD